MQETDEFLLKSHFQQIVMTKLWHLNF